LIRETPTRTTRNRAWLPGTAQLLRGAIVAILAVAVRRVGSSVRVFWKPGFSGTHTCSPQNRKGLIQADSSPSTRTGFYAIRPYSSDAIPWRFAPEPRLHELEPLAGGRVPDQRVFMSTPIKTPSRTVLPDGRTEFIIYRRDIANNAPDRITV